MQYEIFACSNFVTWLWYLGRSGVVTCLPLILHFTVLKCWKSVTLLIHFFHCLLVFTLHGQSFGGCQHSFDTWPHGCVNWYALAFSRYSFREWSLILHFLWLGMDDWAQNKNTPVCIVHSPWQILKMLYTHMLIYGEIHVDVRVCEI